MLEAASEVFHPLKSSLVCTWYRSPDFGFMLRLFNPQIGQTTSKHYIITNLTMTKLDNIHMHMMQEPKIILMGEGNTEQV